MKVRMEMSTAAITELMGKAEEIVNNHEQLKQDLDKAFVESFERVSAAARYQEAL